MYDPLGSQFCLHVSFFRSPIDRSKATTPLPNHAYCTQGAQLATGPSLPLAGALPFHYPPTVVSRYVEKTLASGAHCYSPCPNATTPSCLSLQHLMVSCDTYTPANCVPYCPTTYCCCDMIRSPALYLPPPVAESHGPDSFSPAPHTSPDQQLCRTTCPGSRSGAEWLSLIHISEPTRPY